MEASLDLSRWRDAPLGVGYRRWTIVRAGLRDVMRLRFFKALLVIAWSAGAAIAILGFAFSQSVAEGGWLETIATKFGPRSQAQVSAIGAFVLLYPDICIGGFYTLVFWLHSFAGLWLGLLGLTVVVPRLITRDRASNALIVYLARPLTSTDYLLGKLGIIVGVLALVWTGPLLFGWILSVAFAPNADFVVHSFTPLLRALWFNAVGLVSLAAIALGVSAISRTSRTTIVIWLGLWIILGFVTLAPRTPVWLQRASFTHNLTKARNGILRPDEALITAGRELPLTDRQFATNLTRAGERTQTTDRDGALMALGAFVVVSSAIFLRRLRPE